MKGSCHQETDHQRQTVITVDEIFLRSVCAPFVALYFALCFVSFFVYFYLPSFLRKMHYTIFTVFVLFYALLRFIALFCALLHSILLLFL